MPRVKIGVPPEQLAIEDELRERYGGMMKALDVARELGLKHHSSYENWLSDVPHVIVNGLKKWRVKDVAEKIYQNYSA